MGSSAGNEPRKLWIASAVPSGTWNSRCCKSPPWSLLYFLLDLFLWFVRFSSLPWVSRAVSSVSRKARRKELRRRTNRTPSITRLLRKAESKRRSMRPVCSVAFLLLETNLFSWGTRKLGAACCSYSWKSNISISLLYWTPVVRY